MLGDFLISLIRTWVPIAVGAVLSWLAARGLNLDPSVSAGAIAALTGLLSAAYYAVARALELRFRWAGVLLGAKKAPAYPAKVTASGG